jgi:hypothetical protein
MGGFVGGWRNNDALFGVLLAVSGSMEAAKRVGFAVIGLGALGAAGWARSVREAYWVVALTILLVSANVHPWYLTWVMPLAVFSWPGPVLVWGALAPIHYVVLVKWRTEHIWDGLSPWRWVVYVPVMAVLMVQLVRRTRVGDPRS